MAIESGTGGGRIAPHVGVPPAPVLVDESRRADLLVLGHRGRGAFTGMLVGSVSMHCVSNAVCPVVVVRGRA